MPTGLELYGHLENLSETTKQRIRNGFDEIRAISGWENFRIPSYVWDYVEEYERDRILDWLQNELYVVRTAPLDYGIPQDLQLAYSYTFFLLFEWWRDTPNKPTMDNLFASIKTDFGVPENKILVSYLDSEVFVFSVEHPLSLSTAGVYTADFWDLTTDQCGMVSIAIGTFDDMIAYSVDTDEEYANFFASDATDIVDISALGDGVWDDTGVLAVWDTGISDIEITSIEITSTSTANVLETKLSSSINLNNLKAAATSSTDISETFMNKYLTLKVESVSSSILSFNKYNVIDFNMSGQYVLSSEYIVYANVINLNPDEFCEYSFSVDDPSKITIISQNGNTFRFYMRNNETVDVFVTATIFKYTHSDFTKTIVKEINNMISVGHEIYAPIYGIVDKMNPEIQHKLEHGIYKLKEIPIFKDLKIPVNVWNYIDIKFRDKLLEDIYDAIYKRRVFTSHFGSTTSNFSKNEIFALTYIIHLMNAWYYKTPSDQKPSFFDFNSDYIANNWGILNLNENLNGNTKTFSLDLNGYLGDVNLYFEIENDTELSTLSRLDYLSISNGNYTELCFAPSLNDSYFKDVIAGSGYLHKFSNHKEYAITTDNYITFYNNLNVYKSDFYEVPYYVSCVANETYGVPPFTYNWSVESEGQYFYLDNGNIISLAILTPDVKYNVKCIVEDASGYYRELEDTIILNSSLPEPSKLLSNMKLDFNFYKGKIKIPFDIPDENKNAILEEINLYVNKNINLLLTYMRQRVSKGKFVDKVSSVKDIVVDNKYFLHTIDFDENEIFFYLKCSTDYSPKTAISRIYAIIYHVMTIHGYMNNVGGITIEYEPVLYSNRIIEDLKTYLNRMWKTKYFNINLQDAFDAMQKEVDLFLGSRTRYYSDANFERSLYKK